MKKLFPKPEFVPTINPRPAPNPLPNPKQIYTKQQKSPQPTKVKLTVTPKETKAARLEEVESQSSFAAILLQSSAEE